MEVKTYFLYTNSLMGTIDEFVGPILPEEIKSCEEKMFEPHEQVSVLEEDSFRMFYPEEYVKDFQDNWTDYVDTLLESYGYETDIFNPDVPDEEDFDGDIDVEKDVIDIYGLCTITKDKDILSIRFDIEANPVDVALVTQKLIKYTEEIFEVQIEDYLFVKVESESTAKVYLGEEAVEQYFNDKLYQYDLN